jgi:simple sugar transport system ATP-binding protein
VWEPPANKEVAQQILLDVIGFRGVGITVDSTVTNPSGASVKGVAIGRAMHYNADLIVLDEPTAVLIGAVDAELCTII